jgi:serine/threonine-protein kinase
MTAEVVEIPSRRFGRYRVRSRLGSGGMAELFVADVVDELGNERTVALKLMRPNASSDAFAAEADLMGLLQHPNLVERLEVGEAFGRPFIAMEFLLAGDLAQLRTSLVKQDQVFPLGMACYTVLEVLKGLAHFHQLRTLSGRPLELVHGDVNPANVLFSAEGAVKLADFGVANSGVANLGPETGIAAGKLHYLSPEQVKGEPLRAASDLFSVGIVLHELVLGRHPFHSGPGDVNTVMSALRAAKLSLPTTLERNLGALLKRALHPDGKGRFRSAGEFAGALTQTALEMGVLPSHVQFQSWLTEALGLLV